LPWASTLQHINFGLVLGMSTRKGKAVFSDDIIEQATQVMRQQMMKNEEKYQAIEDPENTSLQVGITAIKIQDMTAKRFSCTIIHLQRHTLILARFRRYNYEFSWERMTSFEGDTGPYLQYAHVRVASLSRKNPHLLLLPSPSAIDISDLTTSARVRSIVYPSGILPGRGPDCTQDPRAGRDRDIRVQAEPRNCECLGDGGGQGRGGFGQGACQAVVLSMRAVCARRHLALTDGPAFGEDVMIGGPSL
jgi:hypothetical protein